MVPNLYELFEVIENVLRFHDLNFNLSQPDEHGFEIEISTDKNNEDGIIDMLNNEIYKFILTRQRGKNIVGNIEKRASMSRGRTILTLNFRLME